MATLESTLFVLLLILSFGLIVPELFKKLKIPFVTSLVLIGSILGPHGIDYIQSNEVISFLGFLGMTFLMLMAGLETELGKINKFRKKIIIMAALNGLIPFAVGVSITQFFGYSWLTSIIVGTIFISSSVAIIIPVLESAKVLHRNIGQIIISAVLITDVTSLVILSFILQSVSPITKLPLPAYFVLLIISVLTLFWVLPKVTHYFLHKMLLTEKHHENQLRFIIVLMMAVLAYFSVLGVHPILAAFIVGLTLSNIIKSEKLFTKLYTLGYGFFVPIFFFIIGMEMDLSILMSFDIKNILMIMIVGGLLLSKLFSGYISGRIVKLSSHDSMLFGVSSIIQLTTTLAVTYAASTLNILDSVMVTSIIILSVVTTIVGPLLLKIVLSTQPTKS